MAPNWFTEYDAAVAAAKETHKPILLQFHRDKCAGCKKLYALTYPDTEVAAELYDWFVPLRLDILQNREIPRALRRRVDPLVLRAGLVGQAALSPGRLPRPGRFPRGSAPGQSRGGHNPRPV